jgi:hypothetical protein
LTGAGEQRQRRAGGETDPGGNPASLTVEPACTLRQRVSGAHGQ